MPPSNPSTSITTSETAENTPPSRRNGLNPYITNPTSFPPSTIISHNPDFVTIRDLYPKSSIHLLVLPRSRSKTYRHPFTALDGSDPAFLSALRAECARAKELAASELRRRFGKYSAQDQAREAALSSSFPPSSPPSSPSYHPEGLPPGRDWSASIAVGVHAVPSMSNLHIHVISVDRHSDCLRHRKHYNSFSTPFFVPLEDFPLADDDERRWPGREGYLGREFTCWRCGEGFGTGFKRLKKHLEGEFEAWRAE
jgi:aprataxin